MGRGKLVAIFNNVSFTHLTDRLNSNIDAHNLHLLFTNANNWAPGFEVRLYTNLTARVFDAVYSAMRKSISHFVTGNARSFCQPRPRGRRQAVLAHRRHRPQPRRPDGGGPGRGEPGLHCSDTPQQSNMSVTFSCTAWTGSQ